MMIESALVAVALTLSVTCAVKLEAPAAVGVPLMPPVEELSVRPLGRLPEATAHVYGVGPPSP